MLCRCSVTHNHLFTFISKIRVSYFSIQLANSRQLCHGTVLMRHRHSAMKQSWRPYVLLVFCDTQSLVYLHVKD